MSERREIFVSQYGDQLGNAVLFSPDSANRYSIDGRKPDRVIKFVEVFESERIISVAELDNCIEWLLDYFDGNTIFVDKLRKIRDAT